MDHTGNKQRSIILTRLISFLRKQLSVRVSPFLLCVRAFVRSSRFRPTRLCVFVCLSVCHVFDPRQKNACVACYSSSINIFNSTVGYHEGVTPNPPTAEMFRLIMKIFLISKHKNRLLLKLIYFIFLDQQLMKKFKNHHFSLF